MIAVADPNAHPDAHPRLSRQCQSILDAFIDAPRMQLNCAQLQSIAQRFGARIHDLRKAGHIIEIIQRNNATGLTVYALRVPQEIERIIADNLRTLGVTGAKP